MCLIAFGWQVHPDYPLVLAANRDEYHARAAEPMGWWSDQPGLLAGRDLRAGGTWLGLSRQGRVAAVTNYHDGMSTVSEHSRGDLVAQFVASEAAPETFLQSIPEQRYAGFSLLAGDGETLGYRSNRGDATQRLAGGVYGLGNAALNANREKLARSRERLSHLLSNESVHVDALLDLMQDRTPADDQAASGAVGAGESRALTAPFVVMPDYGTRCTTGIICRADGHVEVVERRFDAGGSATGESRFVFLGSAWNT